MVQIVALLINIRITLITLLFFSTFSPLWSQQEDLSQVWPAKWILSAEGPAKAYSVHYFRKSFSLDSLPETLVVHTSGDNRYQLYVNEHLATLGPLRGDLRHWHYESTDIAPYLTTGKNCIAAVVWNYGSHPPDAQLTVQTGFLLAADDRRFRFLNTNKNWKAIHNPAYSPNIIDRSQVRGYYGAGSKEIVDGNLFIWNWEKKHYDDAEWLPAIEIENAYAKTCKWASRWKLTPRGDLPHERMMSQRFNSVRIAEGVSIPSGFPRQKAAVTIPAHRRARLVFDQGHYTTAYPKLLMSGGKQAKVVMRYVEAPYEDLQKKEKGNRGEVEGKTFFGLFDQFTADGGTQRLYTPLWWRAFRYIEMIVETSEEALVVEDFHSVYSSYPFDQHAEISLEGRNDTEQLVHQILDIGDRTLRACAHEHFMDCPYFEESQFEGDSRVEMLVSYMNYGDPRLGRQAIDQFSWSVNEEGFLSARYPTNSLYYIPNYSLFWIAMLYDYMMHYSEPDFVAAKLPVARLILNYFAGKEREDGTLTRLDYHEFIDWAFPAGEAPRDSLGYAALADLHYLLALQWAVALESELGETYYEHMYREKMERLVTSIRQHYFDETTGTFSDTRYNRSLRSQHTQCMAIITGVTTGKEAKGIMHAALNDPDMTKATLYWQFYIFEALHAAGMGDQYIQELTPWENMIDLGVTTWPETGARSRSECHGWGASPNYHIFKIMAGITSAGPGFQHIRLQPYLGDQPSLRARVPHPSGEIHVDYQQRKGKLKAFIDLPPGTTGELIWHGNKKMLRAGEQEVEL